MKVKRFKTPLWFHPKYDASDGLEYLVDYYFFDTDGSVIVHAIYDHYEKKKCDKFVYDFGAGFDEEFFDSREEAIPAEQRQTENLLRVGKGCTESAIRELLCQYNEDNPGHKLEINAKGTYNDLFRCYDLINSLKQIRSFMKKDK